MAKRSLRLHNYDNEENEFDIFKHLDFSPLRIREKKPLDTS
jgi:hypothetical protein